MKPWLTLIFNFIIEYPIFILTFVSICLYFKLRNYYLKEDQYLQIEEHSPYTQLDQKYLPVYFMLEENNKMDTLNTMIYLKQNYAYYKVINNKNIIIDLNDIQEICLDLKLRPFLNMASNQNITFDIIMDMKGKNGHYHFIVKNKDNFIKVIDYFKKFNIPIIDNREIEKSYQKYPFYPERVKYYIKINKDLINN